MPWANNFYSNALMDFSYLRTQVAAGEKWEEQTLAGRMDVELHDYPGTGANNRHTPKPPAQYGRVCSDC